MPQLTYNSALASSLATRPDQGPWWDEQVLIALRRRDTARLEWLVRIREAQTRI